MKHLPNLLTLGNLFCGCLAIVYVLTAQPYTYLSTADGGIPAWKWVHGAEQMYYASIFIGVAALFDLLDGFVARALKIFSPIGKDLDSLADLVSFGVAPSVIMFKLLWDALMGEKNAFDVNMLGMAPAFLIACFAALRLARFNVTTTPGNKGFFTGMPTPATGIFVGSFPLVFWYNPMNLATLFHNKWLLYGIIILLCWLMVSKIRFIKMMPAKWKLAYFWPQLVILIISGVSIPFLGVASVPFAFLVYVLVSLLYRPPATLDAAATNNQ